MTLICEPLLVVDTTSTECNTTPYTNTVNAFVATAISFQPFSRRKIHPYSTPRKTRRQTYLFFVAIFQFINAIFQFINAIFHTSGIQPCYL
jgi:hypothetical protein